MNTCVSGPVLYTVLNILSIWYILYYILTLYCGLLLLEGLILLIIIEGRWR